MNSIDPRRAAREAIATSPARPATAIVYDSPDARLVVFRLAPGQAVPPHKSTSTVQLTVLEGSGMLSGASHGTSDGTTREHACATGDVVLYAPEELHGMRALGEELLLLATITPRPGSR